MDTSSVDSFTDYKWIILNFTHHSCSVDTVYISQIEMSLLPYKKYLHVNANDHY